MKARIPRLLATGAALGFATLIGCKSEDPMQGIINQLGAAAKAGDKAAIEKMIDAETRLGLNVAKLVLSRPPAQQNAAFDQVRAEVLAKSEDQMTKIRAEITDRVMTKHKDALASGQCKRDNPKPEDMQAVVFPEVPKDEAAAKNVSPDFWLFVGKLRQSKANSVAVRAKCSDNKEFFIHAFQRTGEGTPWTILGVSE